MKSAKIALTNAGHVAQAAQALVRQRCIDLDRQALLIAFLGSRHAPTRGRDNAAVLDRAVNTPTGGYSELLGISNSANVCLRRLGLGHKPASCGFATFNA